MRLTARDRELAAWLARVRGGTVDQVRRRFGLARSPAYRRLRALQVHGLVRRHRPLADRPALYAVSGRRIRVATFDHALAVSELVVARELAGARLVTEVELYRARRERQLSFLAIDGELSLALQCERVPDAVEVSPAGALLAYEIELSSKGRRRREAIFAAYAVSAYQKVIWVVPDPQLAGLIRADTEAMGLAAQMEVRDDITEDSR